MELRAASRSPPTVVSVERVLDTEPGATTNWDIVRKTGPSVAPMNGLIVDEGRRAANGFQRVPIGKDCNEV